MKGERVRWGYGRGTALGSPDLVASRGLLLGACWGVLALVAGGQSLVGQASPHRELAERVTRLREAGRPEALGEALSSGSDVAEVYDAVGLALLWTPASLEDLIRELGAMTSDGLDPRDYHLATLRRTRPWSLDSPAARAELDLLATDAFLRALADLGSGRTPASPSRMALPQAAKDPRGVATDIAAGRVGDAFAAARPNHWIYCKLRAALEDLRDIEAEGGWGAVPAGVALRRDLVDARVPTLRRRLALGGDLEREALERGLRFDAELEAAVRRFQHRHGLNEDGVVGSATLAELNVPVQRRIQQVRVSLERARWVLRGLPESFLAVNVAGARVYLVRNDSVVFETRAVVGSTSTRTPVFRATLESLDLNPTWTVPPGIVDEVLAAIRRDPDHLARQGLRVLDARGRAVDTGTLDFARYRASNFPWILRQDPGPANPLGKVKFVFPNPFHVYLHDTPARELFARERRTFSHGCIRLDDPLGLAERVLGDPAWTRETLEQSIRRGGTRTLRLERPIPVLVLYWTASADLHGELHFYPDVYDRDAAVLRALDGS